MKLSPRSTTLRCSDEIFETIFAWLISKVLGSAALFFLLALAAQWGAFGPVVSNRTGVAHQLPLGKGPEQVALAKHKAQREETDVFVTTHQPEKSSDAAHHTWHT